MKCHYVYDEEAGRVLIPCCWPVVLSGDIRDCICRAELMSEAHFENERFKKEIEKMKAIIKDLQEENELLHHDVNKYITMIEKIKNNE